MSIFALLRRLERISRPAPSLAHDYDLPVQDVEDEVWTGIDCGVGHPEPPQPSPVTTRTSAGGRSAAAGTLPPTAAAEPLTWLGWAVPAILDVLATHRYQQVVGRCSCDIRATTHGTHADYAEHVAPLIAERIACDPARAVAALQNFQPK